jgi:hypothetical protein
MKLKKETTERLIDMVEACGEEYNDALLGELAEELQRRLSEEVALQYEIQRDPTMDNPSGVITQTTVMPRERAENAVEMRIPSRATGRRVVRRLVTDWEETR